MDKILVTGGLGYIGSHTAVELLEQGYEVVIVDDLSNSNPEVLDRIERITNKRPAFYEFNLCDEKKVADLFRNEGGINAIIHFAASKAVGESVEKPLLYYKNNLLSLINLLENMRDYSVPSMVFSSSCTVYGQPDQLPVTEGSPMKPAESPYGNTKQIGEEINRDFCKVNKSVNVIALRYFNPVGAHKSALIGEYPRGVPNNLLPFITQTAAGIRKELQVFGNDYNTPDGSAIRDYIHVVDLAKAHLVALSRMLDKSQEDNYEYFNIGTGKGYSVLEMINTFEKVNKVTVNYRIADRRPGDIEQIYADTSGANKTLGWKAENGIEEMVRSAWEWQKAIDK